MSNFKDFKNHQWFENFNFVRIFSTFILTFQDLLQCKLLDPPKIPGVHFDKRDKHQRKKSGFEDCVSTPLRFTNIKDVLSDGEGENDLNNKNRFCSPFDKITEVNF